MSDEELNSSLAIQGYLNFSELQSALLRGLGAQSFVALAIAIGLALLDSVNLIYTGPQAALIVWLASSIAGYLRGMKTAKTLFASGVPIDLEVEEEEVDDQ
ncbi:MAG TPA: hypothetical protein VLA24_13545 [Pseudomonadales bacterium]|nr:hypothetical protein [Pseudomonadales bacterium]